LIASSDSVHDMTLAHEFAEKARKKHSVAVDKNQASLLVG